MILGSTVKMLARQVPNYHLLSPGIARDSLSVCPCVRCAHGSDREALDGRLVCGRVAGLCDDGYAIVAANGTCDRAEFRRDDGRDIVLTGGEVKDNDNGNGNGKGGGNG